MWIRIESFPVDWQVAPTCGPQFSHLRNGKTRFDKVAAGEQHSVTGSDTSSLGEPSGSCLTSLSLGFPSCKMGIMRQTAGLLGSHEMPTKDTLQMLSRNGRGAGGHCCYSCCCQLTITNNQLGTNGPARPQALGPSGWVISSTKAVK